LESHLRIFAYSVFKVSLSFGHLICGVIFIYIQGAYMTFAQYICTRLARLVAGAVLPGTIFLTSAFASEPNKPVQCTIMPKSGWVSEARIRQVFDEGKYSQVFVKLSRGNCYEFYAIGKDNSITEAYYDPATTELVKSTYMAADGKTKTYDRPNVSNVTPKQSMPDSAKKRTP
jgi:hypothetical protein